MTHDHKHSPDDALERFLARAGQFAAKGRLVPRLKPGLDLGELRRFAARARRHEVPPPPDMTYEEAAEMLELSIEQEEIIRDTSREMNIGRGMYHQSLQRETRDRDVATFHALKAQAAQQGGDDALLRALHRARRAAGGRGRGRR